ncbi:hypothetical protein O0I10_001211 [Lichtheimia ornata]|uniref:Uncharacterized protein n=1 Tax=Lichtheimia ornata TaxID=688661 RepID=A0AAD7Y3E6_9FUNG|nr:uncharacterized protein O0I10_001211 [Lichtheimia ornata]KAJ8663034.1 hypothetical protein O0I10_001211 [Lichtheimia ornata]
MSKIEKSKGTCLPGSVTRQVSRPEDPPFPAHVTTYIRVACSSSFPILFLFNNFMLFSLTLFACEYL